MDWPVLAPVPAEDRRSLVAGLGRRAYRRDEVIFHRGDPAGALHLIAAGHISVRVQDVSPAEQTGLAAGRSVLLHDHSDTGPSPWPPGASGHARHTGRGRCLPPGGGGRHGQRLANS